MMDKRDFESKILTPIADRPQLVGLARYYLDGLWGALQGLENMGHRAVVEFVSAPAPIEYPKMLYSDRDAPFQLLVETQEAEQDALQHGWRLTPRIVEAT